MSCACRKSPFLRVEQLSSATRKTRATLQIVFPQKVLGHGRELVGQSHYRGARHKRSGSGQFQHRNFRPGAEPDGQARRADAAIHVQLRAVLFIPSTVVVIYEMAEVEASVDKIER